MKKFKGLFAFLGLVIAPLVFWISEKGLQLRQSGLDWVPFLTAPFLAALFAYIVSGPPGKKLVGSDDQGGVLLGRFWAVFIFLTIVLVGIAFLLKAEQ